MLSSGKPFEQLGRVGGHVKVLVQLQARSERSVHLQEC